MRLPTPTIIQQIRSAMRRWCAWPRWAITIAAAVFFWFLLLGNQGVVQLRALLHMRSDLQQEISNLKDTIAQLNEEKKRLENPRNLEPVIRRELGFIKPGEILFELGTPPLPPRVDVSSPPPTEVK